MKDEKKRIEDLLSYKILDTPEEEELNELASIASMMMGTSISLISLVDEERQWFKAKRGITAYETKREDSFCKFALDNANEVLVVTDASKDERFVNNPLVTGEPYIRFYAGAPLVTPSGNVLGTLCLIDDKPRDISADQQDGLKLLAKKVMDFLNSRKLLLEQREEIAASAEKLIKLTENIPGTIFQLRRRPNGDLSYDFLKLGNFAMPTDYAVSDLKANPHFGFNFIKEPYKSEFLKSLDNSYKKLSFWNYEYEVKDADGQTEWYIVRGMPDKLDNGDVVWYGIYYEITSHVVYEEAMEQMAFDISHVLRKPVANLVGLSHLVADGNFTADELKEYLGYIQQISNELDGFTHKLNGMYQNKWDVLMKTNRKYRKLK